MNPILTAAPRTPPAPVPVPMPVAVPKVQSITRTDVISKQYTDGDIEILTKGEGGDLAVIEWKINMLLDYMSSQTGTDKLLVVNQYKNLAGGYNIISGREVWNLDYIV